LLHAKRFSIYWTWSYPWESNRDLTEMDNRFSTITEVRRVAWPAYEGPEYSARLFLQGIAGTLELFHLSLLRFQQLLSELTGHPVAVYQRVDQAGQRLPIDAGILDDTDTLMVFGLDHLVSEQEAGPEEIEALRAWLTRDGTCLLLGPHHDVGVSADFNERAMEYAHHRDPLVPRQQRFGQYTRSLMKGLGPITPLPPPTRQRSTCSRSSRSIRRDHILLPKRGIASSTGSCGCRRPTIAPATFCWRIRPSSRRCLAVTTVSNGSGRTLRRSDASTALSRQAVRDRHAGDT
jgi:hypothetical protein